MGTVIANLSGWNALVIAVAMSSPAHGQESQFALDPADEGVWTWIDRMEGEVPSTEVIQALERDADEHFASLALYEEIGVIDVPVEWYADPVEALAVDPLMLDRLDPSEFDIPIVINESVIKSMKYFLGSGRKYFKTWLERAPRYRELMERELEAAGLPRDIVYLSMIESGYNAHAYSHAHAAGLWQFMSATGRMYDLRVDWWVDERRDPEKSTRAAIRYLEDLHEMFDDWYLAFAAYNGGPGRVGRSRKSAGGDVDFWTLQAGPWLHSETDNYVPRIIAAAIIGHHPEWYGFFDIEEHAPFRYDTAVVEGSIEIEVLAECAGISMSDFKVYNPALRRGATPSGRFEIRVPAGTRAAFLRALDGVPAAKRRDWSKHTVATGDTLGRIAEKYEVSIHDIVQSNGLKNADRIYVGMSLIIPIPGASGGTSPVTPPKKEEVKKKPRIHVVRSGDTLFGIAEQYGVTVLQVWEWNSLTDSVIFPGQELVVNDDGNSDVVYVVERGDSLSEIATRYGVSVHQICQWNGTSASDPIFVGQRLTLRLDEGLWRIHIVRSGDSLGRIAREHGVSVSDLQGWNELSTTTIFPGQKIRVRR